MSIPNTKLNTPSRISVAMPIAKLPTQRAMPDAAVTIADNAFHNAFPMSFNVIPISSNFRLLLVSFGLGGSGQFFFLFASPYVRNFLVPSSDRIGRFRFGGFSKVGIRWCKVCRTKYYLSLWGWRFFRTTASGLTLQQRIVPKLPLPQQRKWHTDACLEGGMETEAYTWRGERKKGTDGMAQRAIGDR